MGLDGRQEMMRLGAQREILEEPRHIRTRRLIGLHRRHNAASNSRHPFVYFTQPPHWTTIPTWHQLYTRSMSLVVCMRKAHVWVGGLPDAHTHLHQSEPSTDIEPSGPLL